MTQKRYVVRVVECYIPDLGLKPRIDNDFLDCLQKAGLIICHPTDLRGLTAKCFDIKHPDGLLEPRLWLACLSDNLRAAGFNAVVAPSTEE